MGGSETTGGSEGGSVGDPVSSSDSGGRSSGPWRRLLLGIAVGLPLLAGVGWIAAAAGFGMGTVLPYAMNRFAPAGWAVETGTIGGSWLRRIEVDGLRIEGPDFLLEAPRLVLEYRLRPLLDRTVVVEELTLSHPTARIALPDSAADRTEPDSTALSLASLLAGEPVLGWGGRLDRLSITDGRGVVLSEGAERYTLRQLEVAASGALGPEGLAVRLDTLTAGFLSVLALPSDSSFRSEGRLSLAGRLSGGTLLLDTLALDSEVSRVAGSGTVSFVDRPELWNDADLHVTADPLDLRDLPFLLPEPLEASPNVTMRLAASGDPDSLRVRVEGTLLGGATASGHAVVRASDENASTLDGSIDVGGLELAGWSAPPFDGRARVRATFGLSSLSAGARFTLEGSAWHEPSRLDRSRLMYRPLQAAYDIRGTLPGVDAEVAPMRADVEIRISTETPSRPLATLAGEVTGATAEWAVELRPGSGEVQGRGRVAWGEAAFSVVVEAARARELDLAAVDTAYVSTSLSGQVAGRLEGASFEDLRGRLEVALAPSRVAGTAVDTLFVQSSVHGRSFDGIMLARSGLGDLRTRYSVTVVDSVIRFETDSLAYVRADSADAEAPSGELHGRVSGHWTLSEVRGAAIRAVVDSARWGTTTIREGRLRGTLDGSRIQGEAEATAGGLLATPVRARVRGDVRGSSVAEAVGTLSVSAARTPSDSTSVADTVHVEILAEEPGRFRLTGSARPAEGGRVAFDGAARVFADSVSFEVSADGRVGQPTELLGGARVDSLHLTASGRRLLGSWTEMKGDLVVDRMEWKTLRAERALASARLDSAGVVIDTLDVRSNVLQAHGRGRLPVNGSGGRIDVTARLLDLEPVRELMGLRVLAAGDGTLRTTATGSLDSLAWTADLGLEAMVVNQVRMTGVRLEGEGVVAPPFDFLMGLRSTDAQLTLDRVILPQSEVREVRVTAAGGADSIRVAADAVADDRREASVVLHVDPRPDRRTARIEDIRFQIDDDQWRLVDQAVLSYASGVSVEPVLLRANDQEIRFQGGISEAGDLDFNARMDSTDVGTVADLAGFPRLRGWLSGRARIQGTTSAPEAWIDMAGAFHRANRPPGPVEVEVRANGRRVRGSIQLVDATRGRLGLAGGALVPGADPETILGAGPGSRGEGSSPRTVFGLRSDSIDVTLQADSFDLRWTEAFLSDDVLSSVGGKLDGSMRLQGSSAAPELSGAIRMSDGSARPTALGVAWDGIRMTLRGDGTALVLDAARMEGASGTATASGTIGATGTMPLDLDVGFDDFRAIRTDAYWALVSGSLDVTGEAMAPVIDGEIRVEALDVFLDERVTSEGLEPVELSEEDLQMLRERFGIVPDQGQADRTLLERITADLDVILGRDSWLRKRTSPEMAVPFTGTIDVELRPGQPPMLQGSVEVIEGRGFVEQFGRRFVLAGGTVTFNGPPEDTRVDLEATYTIPSRDNPDDAEVTIILQVTGTQDDLSLTLSSDPPLENADIVSYIATGRPAAGSLSFESGSTEGGLVAAGADLALSRMTSLIEGAAARSVGLDVVEIRREGLRQATLVAGKYVTPRLYVGFAQPVSLQEGDGLSFGSEGRSELEIEYSAWRWLLLNVEGSGSSVRFFLRGRYAY